MAPSVTEPQLQDDIHSSDPERTQKGVQAQTAFMNLTGLQRPEDESQSHSSVNSDSDNGSQNGSGVHNGAESHKSVQLHNSLGSHNGVEFQNDVEQYNGILPKNGIRNKLLEQVVRTPGRMPSPQPTHLSNAHPSVHRVLHEEGPGYVAPKFEGKELQMDQGGFRICTPIFPKYHH